MPVHFGPRVPVGAWSCPRHSPVVDLGLPSIGNLIGRKLADHVRCPEADVRGMLRASPWLGDPDVVQRRLGCRVSGPCEEVRRAQ
jgi:hypothetical protein